MDVNGLIPTGLTVSLIVLPLASFLPCFGSVLLISVCFCFRSFDLGCWLFAFLAFLVPVGIYSSSISPVSCMNWRRISVSSGCSSPSMLESVNGMLCVVQYVFICVRSCSIVGH